MIPTSYLKVGAHVSAFSNNSKEAAIFRRKLRKILLSRVGLYNEQSLDDGEDMSIWDVLKDAGFEEYSVDPIFDDGGWGYDAIEGAIGYNTSGAVISAMVESNLIGYFEFVVSKEDFETEVSSWSDDEQNYYSPEQVEEWLEMLPLMRDFRDALEHSENGECAKAMENQVYSDLIHHFSFELDCPDELVMKNLELLVSTFFAAEDHYSTFYCYKSKEIYDYEKYRDNLPEEIRERCDLAVRQFFDPFNEGDLQGVKPYFDDKEGVCYCLMEHIGGSEAELSFDECDKWLFLPEALSIIKNEFPKYKEEYGNA